MLDARPLTSTPDSRRSGLTTSRVGPGPGGRAARIGEECVIGRGATIDGGVVIGDRVKVQASALVYRPAVLEDGVFIGPAAVLTNDLHPRAITPEGTAKTGCRLGTGRRRRTPMAPPSAPGPCAWHR